MTIRPLTTAITVALSWLAALQPLAVVAVEPSSGEATENKVAPESETSVKPAQPSVIKLSADQYQIGKITFNKKTREISLTAQTNITDPGTPLEFVLVHSNGEKVHESLLATEADPTNLNIALKLLNYKESQELFKPINADGSRNENYPTVADDIRTAARFSIHISWKEGKELKKAPISQWLQHRITNKPMPSTPWVYNGSYIHQNKFKAKLNGNILAILPNESGLASYPGDDRYDDTLWVPAENVAREGSKVTITLKPWTGKL